jgi:DNA-binding Lrp family transcriptional regulator
VAGDGPFRVGTVISASILIQTQVGEVGVVVGELEGVKGVAPAEAVTGPYDVIARADARTLDELGRLVVGRIQAIAGVTRTQTCPVVRL